MKGAAAVAAMTGVGIMRWNWLAASLIVLAAAGTAACGGSGPAAAPVPSAAPSPTFTALSLVQACKVLRSDIVANGGSPDRATLQRIIGHSTDGHLILDAQNALPDIGKSDGGIAMGFDLAFFYRDCRSTGVQIPQNPGQV